MKILITGVGGFVSRHFLSLLNEKEPGAEVIGLDKTVTGLDPAAYPKLRIRFIAHNLSDRAATKEILSAYRPGYLLHLASVSSVAKSWEAPAETFINNTGIFLNIAEAIRSGNFPCRILSVGSSEEFGEVDENELPLTEGHPLKPLSPYAAARVSQEILSKLYADGYSMDIIMTRSFNHIGPGQKEQFAISSFAKQLVQLAKDGSTGKSISTGDLSVTRDLVDVRDVVKAYYLLLKKGRAGEVYNICSGMGVVLKEVITKMSELLNITVETKTDPQRVRPSENKKIIGSYQKIKTELGWEPTIPLEKSLTDILDYWRSAVD